MHKIGYLTNLCYHCKPYHYPLPVQKIFLPKSIGPIPEILRWQFWKNFVLPYKYCTLRDVIMLMIGVIWSYQNYFMYRYIKTLCLPLCRRNELLAQINVIQYMSSILKYVLLSYFTWTLPVNITVDLAWCDLRNLRQWW